MKPKLQRTLAFIGLLLASITLLFLVDYSNSVSREAEQITTALQVGRIALSEEHIMKVNQMILSGSDRLTILKSAPYQNLVHTLNEFSAAAPFKVLWSYLMLPTTLENIDNLASLRGQQVKPSSISDGWIILSVLTVPFDPKDPDTLPGVIFDTTPYPAMYRLLHSTADVTTSPITYDMTYGTWNRAGFIKVWDDEKRLVASLALEITMETEVWIIGSSLLFSVVFGSILSTLVWFAIFWPWIILTKAHELE
jgi:hypothetical protein